jgi:serine protease
MKRSALLLGGVAFLQLAGCMTEEVDTTSTGEDVPSFEEFEASVAREPDTGIYIVNGDEPVGSRDALYAFYERLYLGEGSLIVNTVNGADDVWTATEKRNLTYCIGNFGANQAAVVAAVTAATAAWEAAADVDYVHVPSQDGALCTANNPNVVFDIRSTWVPFYIARAFFPSSPRNQSNVLISTSAFTGLQPPLTLTGVLTHELGHTLGFRHEHTRPEAGTCFEDNNWRPLTGYDRDSTMHYPQCNGNSAKDLTLTDWDRQGAASLYGEPDGDPDPDPDPEETTRTFTGSLNWFARSVTLPAFSVVPATTFSVATTGSRNLDLYVAFGRAPTESSYDCRSNGATGTESCVRPVPAGATSAQVLIVSRALLANTYSATVTFTEP